MYKLMKKLLILLLLISSEAWAGNCKFYDELGGDKLMNKRYITYEVCEIENHICVMNNGVFCFPKTKSK